MLAGLVEARKGSPSVHRLELGDRHQTYSIYVQYMYMQTLKNLLYLIIILSTLTRTYSIYVQYMYTQTLKKPLVLDHNTFHIN